MHDLGRVLRQSLTAVLMLLGDPTKYMIEFRQGCIADSHQRVANSERRDLIDKRPIVLAVQNDFVVVKTHDQLYGARQDCRPPVPVVRWTRLLLVPVNAD